jgi:hypothetical protein
MPANPAAMPSDVISDFFIGHLDLSDIEYYQAIDSNIAQLIRASAEP